MATTDAQQRLYVNLSANVQLRKALDEQDQNILALLAGQKTTLEGEGSKADPTAPPGVYLCQLGKWVIFNLTDQTYAEYCIAHAECTPT